MIARALLLLAIGMTAVACASRPSPIDEALFLVEACADQHFTVLVQDRDVIREAEALIGRPDQKIVMGTLRRGDGGFNAPWSWHLAPGTVGFAEATIELCDGCPDFVERELDYWVDTVRQYCPWTTRIVSRLR